MKTENSGCQAAPERLPNLEKGGAARHGEPAGLTMERPFKKSMEASARASVKPIQRLYRPMASGNLLAKLL